MVLKDSNRVNVSEISYGAQYNMLIVLSILERIINHVKKVKDDKQLQTLLILDEPEIHLHPYLQRTLMKDILKKIVSGKDEEFNSIINQLFGIDEFSGQVIIATHSPNTISDDYKKLSGCILSKELPMLLTQRALL